MRLSIKHRQKRRYSLGALLKWKRKLKNTDINSILAVDLNSCTEEKSQGELKLL